jgi:hypothetical protein
MRRFIEGESLRALHVEGATRAPEIEEIVGAITMVAVSAQKDSAL